MAIFFGVIDQSGEQRFADALTAHRIWHGGGRGDDQCGRGGGPSERRRVAVLRIGKAAAGSGGGFGDVRGVDQGLLRSVGVCPITGAKRCGSVPLFRKFCASGGEVGGWRGRAVGAGEEQIRRRHLQKSKKNSKIA
jgi:hypothetical protein